jgi:hypothetical protein
MQKHTWVRTAILVTALGLGTGSSAAIAQTIWAPATVDNPTVMLEVARPVLNDDVGNLSTPSGAMFASMWWPVSSRILAVAEVPFSYGRLTSPDGTARIENTAFGNPYVGIEYRFSGSPLFLEAGARAPLAPEDELVATIVGVTSDLDRWEAFATDAVPVLTMLNYTPRLSSGWVMRLRGGAVNWIPTSGDYDLYGLADAQGGYAGHRFLVLAGGTGRALLTENGSFGNRTAFQLGAGGWYEFGRVRPGLQFRLPVDSDLTEISDFTFGLSADVRLN